MNKRQRKVFSPEELEKTWGLFKGQMDLPRWDPKQAKLTDEEEEEVGNHPCKKCGRTDLFLHINYVCTECFEEGETEDEV